MKTKTERIQEPIRGQKSGYQMREGHILPELNHYLILTKNGFKFDQTKYGVVIYKSIAK